MKMDAFILHRYPGTTFMDHVMRYHDDPNVKMIVVLGEVWNFQPPNIQLSVPQ